MNWKNMVRSFCFTAFISLVFFYAFEGGEMHTVLYVAMMVCLGLLMIVQYHCKDNIDLFVKLLVAAVSNFVAFLFMKYWSGYRLLLDTEDKVGITYGILLIVSLGACGFGKWRLSRRPEEVQEELPLFPERICDKERLEEYLKKFPCVGVQALWGNGKSFLVDHLELDSYSAIKIDLLTCNLDEIQIVLLQEIDRVLKENGIFSSYSPKLRKILRQNKFGQSIGQLFVQDDSSYSEAITGLQKDIGKLKKKLLIVYEDLDRIQNPDVIRKVLSISEKIAGDNIRIIYQYDEKRLNKKLEDGREYLEKYIPVTVNITEIHWSHILDYLLEKMEGKYPLDKDDFQFLKFPIHMPHFQELDIKEGADPIQIPNMTIRKMENFIDELGTALNQNSEYMKYKKIVIVFFLIKNFYYEIYNKLIPGKSLLDIFLFHYDGNEANILNWYRYFADRKNEDITKMLKAKENATSTSIISLLGYHCDIYEGKLEMRNGIDVSKDTLQKRNDNEKIDRIIWNLLCSGKSEFTDYESVVKRLDSCVFSMPLEIQREAFYKLMNDLHNGRFEANQKRDNNTIFYTGVSDIVLVFQALNFSWANKSQWMKMLDYYVEYCNEEHVISIEWIECISYCNINDKDVYLYVVKKFNELKIQKNMNGYKKYKEFLQEYLSAMSRLGYIETGEVDALRNNRLKLPEDVELIKKDILNNLRGRLETLKATIQSSFMKEEIELLIRFIDHNKELISFPIEHEQQESDSENTLGSGRENKKIYDYLESCEMSDEDFIREVESAYKNGDLVMYEASKLFENRKSAN